MWGTRRAYRRSLHGAPGQVGFARDDKKERVAERGGPLPRDRAQPLVMTEERVVPGREVAEPKPFFIFIGEAFRQVSY